MRVKYPMCVSGDGIGKWFKLNANLTIKPMSGRFIGMNSSNELVLINGSTGGKILGWLDMPNDARVYQMSDIFESTLHPDYTYKAGDHVFLITQDLGDSLFRVPLVGGSLSDVVEGKAMALVVNSDGLQGIDTSYSGTEQHVIIFSAESEEDIIVKPIV